jgi:hypothetical protein
MYRQLGRRDPWPTDLEILGEEYLITHGVAFRCGETEDLYDILRIMEGMLLSGAKNCKAAVRLAQRIVKRTHGSENASKPLEARSISAQEYQQLTAQNQPNLMMQHDDDCVCDYCKPLDAGVSRSATFEVAVAPFRHKEQPTIAEERPRLTLKVER